MPDRTRPMTPRTFAGRCYVYLAVTGGFWAAQWFLYWATGGVVPEPTLFWLFMTALMNLYWFFMPSVPWFPSRRSKDRRM